MTFQNVYAKQISCHGLEQSGMKFQYQIKGNGEKTKVIEASFRGWPRMAIEWSNNAASRDNE